ncbi:MAG: hypothetical protein ACLFRA_06265 [Alphaproteobacteria bacterium]
MDGVPVSNSPRFWDGDPALTPAFQLAQGSAYTYKGFRYEPDFSVNLRATVEELQRQPDPSKHRITHLAGVDISFLHPETGKPTALFWASLDNMDGPVFGLMWQRFYGHILGEDPLTTDPEIIELVLFHMKTAHAVSRPVLDYIGRIGQHVWRQSPDLRENNGASNDFGQAPLQPDDKALADHAAISSSPMMAFGS